MKFRNFGKFYFSPKLTSMDHKKSGNYNEPGRTLHESVFVEILAETFNHDALIES
ncbi:hypothetical protein T11_3284 [Trichinella zimbabwensis]|uniref:Uncharacterized protein n=1 Tax=Trichinella zimbabwensis TaxID=268475 RepID=A0A0V1GM53_9BILA|nr:hypothetical protein T11_18295 [Trichinella zimbabwensis]KRY99383.1 hypothetical protein T11_3284 [Trichinella zimbabwensis]